MKRRKSVRPAPKKMRASFSISGRKRIDLRTESHESLGSWAGPTPEQLKEVQQAASSYTKDSQPIQITFHVVNNRRDSTPRLGRDYWLLPARLAPRHCRWMGELYYGAPTQEEIKKLIRAEYIQAISVIYNGKRHTLFIDDGAELKRSNTFNWRASALAANVQLHKQGDRESLAMLYNGNLTEKPKGSPRAYIVSGFAIVNDALLWEGEFSDMLEPESALDKTLSKLGLTEDREKVRELLRKLESDDPEKDKK